MSADPTLAEFERMRPRLFGIAYRMLGSRVEAEDVVQEAWLRLQRIRGVDSVEGFLVTATTRLAMDQLRSARVRRERYVGPWLPEPIVTTGDDPAREAERSELLSMALLRVLERLEPLERAVFLLREAFGYDYADIARMVDRREDHCRQIAHRARQRVQADRPRLEADPDEHARLLDAFLRASAVGDLAALEALLADDAVLVSDGGGKAVAARNEVVGAGRVARFMAGIALKAPADLVTRRVTLNGLPGAVVDTAGRPDVAIALDVADGRIRAVFMVRNPDKLGGVRA